MLSKVFVIYFKGRGGQGPYTMVMFGYSNDVLSPFCIINAPSSLHASAICAGTCIEPHKD